DFGASRPRATNTGRTKPVASRKCMLRARSRIKPCPPVQRKRRASLDELYQLLHLHLRALVDAQSTALRICMTLRRNGRRWPRPGLAQGARCVRAAHHHQAPDEAEHEEI